MTRFLGALSIVLACSSACTSGDGRPNPSELARPTTPATEDAGTDTIVPPPPPPNTSCGDFCGQRFLPAVSNPPNLYFLLDRSSSMTDMIGPLSKYDTARRVLAELMGVIGTRVSYGASIFPQDLTEADPTKADACVPGMEVFAPAVGGLPPCDGSRDPTLEAFIESFQNHEPFGNTPTAAALANLAPELEGFDGDTYLVLITDGAPNCNEDLQCDASDCIPNIEDDFFGQVECTQDFNCCDAANTTPDANILCVDTDETVEQIKRLAAHQIPTYVIGMPGTEEYAGVLNQFAEAGTTARDGDVEYYAVTDEDELQAALYAIGTGLAIQCSIELDAPPDDPAQVNVYFDGELIPSDPTDGWSWQDATTIQVNGAACDRLKSGDVVDARAVFGCDTVVR